MALFNKKAISIIPRFAKILECITLILPMCYLGSFFYNIWIWKNACNNKTSPFIWEQHRFLTAKWKTNKQTLETMLKKKEITIHWMQKPINDSALQTYELSITTAATWYPTYSIKLLLDKQSISVVFKLLMPLKNWKKSACFPRKLSQDYDAKVF